MFNYDKDEPIVQPSLQSQLTQLTCMCKAACESEDDNLLYKASRLASDISDKLWQYYMEVHKL